MISPEIAGKCRGKASGLRDNGRMPCFTSTAGSFRHVLAGRSELRGAPPLSTLCPEVELTAAPSSRAGAKGFGAGKGLQWTTRPGRPASTPRLTGSRARAPAGSAVAISASAPGAVAMTAAGRAGRMCPARPMPRSISAPTTAGCWSRAPTRDSFRVDRRVLAHHPARRGHRQLRPARARPRSRARSRRCASAATRCATAASPARA